jgi:hypothetical protein
MLMNLLHLNRWRKDTVMENPVVSLLRGPLPACDFAVLRHGFAPHGRDYAFVIQDSLGTHELTFTHVVHLQYDTSVGADAWLRSWSNEFLDYAAWLAGGEPAGYVWGTNWSLAYPGISLPGNSPEAEGWSRRLDRPMHAIVIETDRFSISLTFGDVKLQKLSDDASVIRQVIIPLSRPP